MKYSETQQLRRNMLPLLRGPVVGWYKSSYQNLDLSILRVTFCTFCCDFIFFFSRSKQIVNNTKNLIINRKGKHSGEASSVLIVHQVPYILKNVFTVCTARSIQPARPIHKFRSELNNLIWKCLWFSTGELSLYLPVVIGSSSRSLHLHYF